MLNVAFDNEIDIGGLRMLFSVKLVICCKIILSNILKTIRMEL